MGPEKKGMSRNPALREMSIGAKYLFGNRLICYRCFPPASLLITPIIIQRVRVTHAASSFSPSFLTFDANACGSYFLYPLLDVFSSRPVGAINAEVPGVRVYSLSANNLHRAKLCWIDHLCWWHKKFLCSFTQELYLDVR